MNICPQANRLKAPLFFYELSRSSWVMLHRYDSTIQIHHQGSSGRTNGFTRRRPT